MQEFPKEVENALLNGIGAFIRATPANELDPGLRRYRSLRQQALGQHRRELLDLLDDEIFRKRVLHWLEQSKPRIPREQRTIFEQALRREEGWEELLGEHVAPRPKPQAPVARSKDDALKREQERTRRAREDARRARDERDRLVTAARGEVTRLQAELHDVRARVAQLERALRDSTRALDKANAELDRERRKVRSAAERAERDKDQIRRRARAESERHKERIAELKSAFPRKKPASPRKAERPPRPAARTPLDVPKGRFEDDPETLTDWLAQPSVRLLVDGYNVAKAEGGFGDVELEAQRKRVVDEVARLARRHGIEATVVFDGSDVVAPGRRARGPVRVEYSRPGEIADDHLVALLEKLPTDPVVVVTSDRELQARVRVLGATVATSQQLLALIR